MHGLQAHDACHASDADGFEGLKKRISMMPSRQLVAACDKEFGRIDAEPGEIVDLSGRVLGRHEGIIHYTIGQRRGIRVPSNTDNEAYVVVGKRAATPEGGAVVIDITGGVTRHIVCEVAGGRAAVVATPTAAPLATITLIVKELQKPGLDPRGVAEAVTFDDTVRGINDLQVGMELWGVVTNMTNFGAFVDIGVKQDGLVHISQLGYKFVKNPAEVVSLSQRVKVRVLEVDRARKRIQLTMKF